MKQYKYFLSFTILMIMMLLDVNAANCNSYIHKNNVCEKVGTYSDPDFSCNPHKKEINRYCSISCREDAHTYFPNDIPYLSVDQYNAILGGNHFRWEEIKTDSTITCRTNIKYQLWLDEFKDLIGNPNVKPKKGIEISLKEMHQRYTDVKTCDLIKFVKNDGALSGYPSITQNYWRSVKKNKGASGIQKILQNAGITENNCNNCAGYKVVNEAIGYAEQNQRVGESLSVVLSIIKNYYNIKQSKNEMEKLIDLKPKHDNDYPHNANTFITTYRFCVGAKNSDGTRNLYKWNDKNCKDIVTQKKVGEIRLYHKVEGEDLVNGIGLKPSNPEYDKYCTPKEAIPYNSEGYDIYWNVTSNTQTGKSNGKTDVYEASVIKLQELIQEKLAQLEKCITESNKMFEGKTNSTSITVKYNDPMKIYSRDVELKKNTIKESKKVESKDDHFVQMATGVSWTVCPITTNDLIKKIKKTLETGNLDYAKVDCTTEILSTKKRLLKESISETRTSEYQYTMPKNVYNYILKTTGEAIYAPKKDKDDAKDPYNNRFVNEINKHRYIDIGYPNYPVHFTTPTGTYPIKLVYKNIGWNGHLVKEAEYKCYYKVINRVVCENPPCETPPPTIDPPIPTNPPNPTPTPNPPSPSDPPTPPKLKNPGVNIIYRSISLTNPFPGEDATNMSTDTLGRTPGENWSKQDVDKYITNNRGADQNEIYEKTPLYSFTLDPNAIREIRKYNNEVDDDTGKKRDYDDFRLSCNKYGKRCKSDFLKIVESKGVKVNRLNSTCFNQSQTNFYTCANKPNQDRIKCYVSKKTKKLTCIDCNDKENKKNELCIDCTDKSNKNHPKCKTS